MENEVILSPLYDLHLLSWLVLCLFGYLWASSSLQREVNGKKKTRKKRVETSKQRWTWYLKKNIHTVSSCVWRHSGVENRDAESNSRMLQDFSKWLKVQFGVYGEIRSSLLSTLLRDSTETPQCFVPRLLYDDGESFFFGVERKYKL